MSAKPQNTPGAASDQAAVINPTLTTAQANKDKAPDQPSSTELPSTKSGKFNAAQFRVAEGDYRENAGGKKLLTTVPVRKPSKESWFRTHPDPAYRFPARLIELKEQNEVYLVARDLWPELDGESTFITKLLVPVKTRQQALLM